jgi:prolipoprotein diacylglyceryltransferase
MFNGMERFLIEKIRVNNVFDLWGLEVTQAEVISTLIFLGGLVLAVVLLIHQNKKRV